MYERFFKLARKPFGASPDAGCFFPSDLHEEALAGLRYAVTQSSGIALLVGAAGTGKTIVCQRLIAELSDRITTAVITNTHLSSPKALLQAILYDLRLPYRGIDEEELRLSLTDFLIGKHLADSAALVVVDEAHHLSGELLEELRMLTNLEGGGRKLLQVILVGDARLEDRLAEPDLTALNQRIAVRCRLATLDREAAAEYVRFQLEWAGRGSDDIFRGDALDAIYESTGGVPRAINQLCDRALLLACATGRPYVDADLLNRAAEGCGLSCVTVEVESGEIDEPATPRRETVAPAASRVQPARTTAEAPCAIEVGWEPSAESWPAQPTSPAPILGDERFEYEEAIVDQYAALDARTHPICSSVYSVGIRSLPREPKRAVGRVTVTGREAGELLEDTLEQDLETLTPTGRTPPSRKGGSAGGAAKLFDDHAHRPATSDDTISREPTTSSSPGSPKPRGGPVPQVRVFSATRKQN